MEISNRRLIKKLKHIKKIVYIIACVTVSFSISSCGCDCHCPYSTTGRPMNGQYNQPPQQQTYNNDYNYNQQQQAYNNDYNYNQQQQNKQSKVSSIKEFVNEYTELTPVFVVFLGVMIFCICWWIRGDNKNKRRDEFFRNLKE